MLQPTKATLRAQLAAALAAHARLLETTQRDKGAPGIVFAAGMLVGMVLVWLGQWLA